MQYNGNSFIFLFVKLLSPIIFVIICLRDRVPTVIVRQYSQVLITQTVAEIWQFFGFAVAKVPSRRYRNSESRVPSTFYLW